MKKNDFLDELRTSLRGLSKKEIEGRVAFYSEMIDDRTEEGVSEQAVIAEIGSPSEVAEQIKAELASAKAEGRADVAKEKITPMEIVLLALGSPLWITLIVCAAAVIISVFAVMWSLVLCLWVIELPFFIFSYISRALLIGCEKVSCGSWIVTKRCCSLIKKMTRGFGRRRI